ncbi:MAG: 3-isopropylmalate dehydrogenase [Acidobacteriota bacterium]
MRVKVLVLPGDGIGPEVVAPAVDVLQRTAALFDHRLEIVEGLIGGRAVETQGRALPVETLQAAHEADAVLLGAVGTPELAEAPAHQRPEQALLELRRSLRLHANLRPILPRRELLDVSPLKRDRLEGVDLLIVRELTSGIYYGRPRAIHEDEDGARAIDTMAYQHGEIARVTRLACEIARSRRGRVTSVDKANVLDCSRLWRRVVNEVAADFPDVVVEHRLIDAAAYELVAHPSRFDVVLAPNLFGDILSDQCGALVGSLGLLPSASLGAGKGRRRFGLFEPVHGSAPDLVGTGRANPIATIDSVALLFELGLGLAEEATSIRRAIEHALAEGPLTPELAGDGPTATTEELGTRVLERLTAPSPLGHGG